MNYFEYKKTYFLMLGEKDYSGDYLWGIKEDNTVILIRYIGNDIKVTVPDKIKSKKVTEIAPSCFSYLKNIEQIKIPKTIAKVG